MNYADKKAAVGRVRAKIAADRARPARNRLYDMLCATNTSADANALLDRAERESDTADRLRAVMNLCDQIERGNPTPEIAAVVLRIHHAALGDKPAHADVVQIPGRRPASELPDWAVSQLSDRGIDDSEVSHFIASSDGRTIAAAVDGKPVHLTRP